MSHSRQITSQNSTSSSRVSSASRVQEDTSRVTGTLRLRAEGDASTTRDETPARRIRWSEDVVDNEGMGKKSSKVCCIYHKARPVGESSSESESSDSSSSDSDDDSDAERSNARRSCRNHNHRRSNAQKSPERGRAPDSHSHSNEKGRRRKPSPNAYEKMPKYWNFTFAKHFNTQASVNLSHAYRKSDRMGPCMNQNTRNEETGIRATLASKTRRLKNLQIITRANHFIQPGIARLHRGPGFLSQALEAWLIPRTRTSGLQVYLQTAISARDTGGVGIANAVDDKPLLLI